jgi:hypothetical protein
MSLPTREEIQEAITRGVELAKEEPLPGESFEQWQARIAKPLNDLFEEATRTPSEHRLSENHGQR